MLTLALAVILAAPARAADTPTLRVLSVEGGMLTADGHPAAAGTPLADGAVVRLDAGKAALDLAGQGRILLKGPAELTLGASGLDLRRGGVLHVLDALRGTFTVKTPAAVAAVRGTEFYVEARGLEQTYLCLCSGRLEVRGPDGGAARFRLKARHHTAWLFTSQGARLTRAKAAMERHDDAELAALRSRGAKGP